MQKIPCLYKGFEKYCPYNTNGNSCQITVHHLWWPKRLFRSRMRKQFRELPQHKIKVCRGIHDLFHLINLIPNPPANRLIKSMVGVSKQEAEERRQRYRRDAYQHEAKKSDK